VEHKTFKRETTIISSAGPTLAGSGAFNGETRKKKEKRKKENAAPWTGKEEFRTLKVEIFSRISSTSNSNYRRTMPNNLYYPSILF